MTDIDLNKIAAQTGAELTKELTKQLISYIPGKINSLFTVYFDSFNEAMHRMHKSCGSVRTIINKDKSIPIDDIYVKTRFRCNNSLKTDDDLCQMVRDGKRIVVTGYGGIGKTVFCRYIWMSIFRNGQGKIPIYFELRNINNISTKNLFYFLRMSIHHKETYVSEDDFERMLTSGRFIFILDAFDEIPTEFRDEIQRQITEFASRYDQCGFVVSSRADNRFFSWQEFEQYHAINFDRDQSREVIQRTEFDSDIKKEFLAKIHSERFDDYKDFFATPLLTLMMLMTYNQIKYIPNSPHIFYRYAFQTLYTLHDASKQGFQRKRHVDMSESEFAHVFSLFCLASYADMLHSFTNETMRHYIT